MQQNFYLSRVHVARRCTLGRVLSDVRHVPRGCADSGQGGEPAFDDTADEFPLEVLAVVVENALKRKETFS